MTQLLSVTAIAVLSLIGALSLLQRAVPAEVVQIELAAVGGISADELALTSDRLIALRDDDGGWQSAYIW